MRSNIANNTNLNDSFDGIELINEHFDDDYGLQVCRCVINTELNQSSKLKSNQFFTSRILKSLQSIQTVFIHHRPEHPIQTQKMVSNRQTKLLQTCH